MAFDENPYDYSAQNVAPQQREGIFCPNCGTYITQRDVLKCPQCHFQVQGVFERENYLSDEQKINRTNILIAILSIVLGWTGIQRLMTRKFVTGCIWFVTFGFGTIGWFYDIIVNVVRLITHSDYNWKRSLGIK